MLHITNDNRNYADQDLQVDAEYWRTRSEELERQLNETRNLLLRLADNLPAEYLGMLQVRVAEIGNSKMVQ